MAGSASLAGLVSLGGPACQYFTWNRAERFLHSRLPKGMGSPVPDVLLGLGCLCSRPTKVALRCRKCEGERALPTKSARKARLPARFVGSIAPCIGPSLLSIRRAASGSQPQPSTWGLALLSSGPLSSFATWIPRLTLRVDLALPSLQLRHPHTA